MYINLLKLIIIHQIEFDWIDCETTCNRIVLNDRHLDVILIENGKWHRLHEWYLFGHNQSSSNRTDRSSVVDPSINFTA